MTDDDVYQATTDFLIDHGFTLFPIDPFAMVKTLGFKLIPYRIIPQPILGEIMSISRDGLTVSGGWLDPGKTVICYNDNASWHHRRFTVAHELGHQVLDLPGGDKASEVLANKFAGYLLAPTPIVQRDSLVDARTISRNFEVSLPCAQIVVNRIHRQMQGGNSMREYEKRLLDHCQFDWLGGVYLQTA